MVAPSILHLLLLAKGQCLQATLPGAANEFLNPTAARRILCPLSADNIVSGPVRNTEVVP